MWSKIMSNGDTLAAIAYLNITSNTYDTTEMSTFHTHCDKILYYHNIDHVKSMYDYLEKTNEPYSLELDYAILFHDVIYDKEPNKEIRSAEFFMKCYEQYPVKGLDPYLVVKYILATENHLCHDKILSPIIRADLHQLSNKVKAFTNYYDIMKESMALYNIDEIQFAKASKDFMSGMLSIMNRNMGLDEDHISFYFKVKNGILTTIAISNVILGE